MGRPLSITGRKINSSRRKRAKGMKRQLTAEDVHITENQGPGAGAGALGALQALEPETRKT